MDFATPAGTVRLIDEPDYTFGSADNVCRYPSERLLEPGFEPLSVCGVWLDERPLMVVGDAAGPTRIHEHSLICVREAAYLAVGRRVVKLVLQPFYVAWSLPVDDSICFGIHFSPERDALLSHGELEICRFSEEGAVLWSTSGADIFSEGFSLHSHFVEAIDFDRQVYRFSYEHGELLAEHRL